MPLPEENEGHVFGKCQLVVSPGKVDGGFSGGQRLVVLD